MIDLKAFAGARHSGIIENGEYEAVVEKMEWAVSEGGDDMLIATLSILLAHAKKKVRDYFNLRNKNKQAADISASRLADLVGACGLKEPPSDARVFEGMKCKVRVGVDKNGYNTIDRYMYWCPINNNEVFKSNLVRFSQEVPSANTEVPSTNQEYLNHYVPEYVPVVDEEFKDSNDFGSEPF